MDSVTQPEKINVSDFYWTTIFLFTCLNSIENFKHPACLCKGLKKNSICPYCGLTIFYQQNLKNGKLSFRAWKLLQKALEIKIENPSLTTRQVKNCRHLLVLLIDKCPLMKSEEILEAELRLWLQTKLPKSYQEVLPLISGEATKGKPPTSNSEKKSSVEEIKIQSEMLTLIQTNEISQLKIELTIASVPKRKRITYKAFATLVQRQGMFCYWCKVKVIPERKIPTRKRVISNGEYIVFRHEGKLHQEKKATIDHLKRVCEGGTNDLKNLVISCYTCNQERNIDRVGHLARPTEEEKSCPVCRSKFIHSDSKICSICLTDSNQ